MKKKIVFYGNCQLGVLSNILNTNWDYQQKYETAPFSLDLLENYETKYNIFVSRCNETNVSIVKQLVSESDVFIYQHVNGKPNRCEELSSEHLLSLAKGICIKCPNIFLHQFQTSLREDCVSTSDNRMLPAFNYIYFYFYELTKRDPKRTLEILKYDNSFECFRTLVSSFDEAAANTIYQMVEKDRRYEERGHDKNSIKVRYEQFLLNNIDNNILCYTANHPTFVYFDFLYEEVGKLLGIDTDNFKCYRDSVVCPRCDDFGPLEYRFITERYSGLSSHDGYYPKAFLTLDFLTKRFNMFDSNYSIIKTRFEQNGMNKLFK